MEANPLSAGFYHIEIVGDNGLALLTYETDVININDQTQWDGLATVGAYNMAFQQECHSVYSPTVKAKLWRGLWVQSTATSPKEQLQVWLQACLKKDSQYQSKEVPAASVLPLEEGDTRRVVSIHIPKADMSWDSLCDVHIDTFFGTQAYLTDIKTGSVTLYFDVATHALIGVVFTAENGQTKISGIITVSTAEGHTLREFPDPTTLTEGTLYEEWNFPETIE